MKEKIMIVDDHEEIREVIQVLLSNEGYQIIEAQNGNLTQSRTCCDNFRR